MQQEDYLLCSAYENQTMHTTETGITVFQNQGTQLYFFAVLDDSGKVLLKSEGYPQITARDNGVQSVIKNRPIKEFYAVKETGGKYFLSLRAANYREIARSCDCTTEAEAMALLPYVTGEQKRKNINITNSNLTMTTNTPSDNRLDDDYLSCSAYEGHIHADAGSQFTDLVAFTDANGKHYFVWYGEDDNQVLMRSEGYPTTAARNNGMASVEKNRDQEDRYAVEEKMGHFFTILKAGNHQEIARSCAKHTHADAMSIFPSGRAAMQRAKIDAKIEEARLKALEQTTVVTGTPFIGSTESTTGVVTSVTTTVVTHEHHRHEDNYAACREYENHGAPDADGITKWQGTNGEYYFTWLNADGTVKMRSEGYPAAASRDNGIGSLLRNKDMKERYSVEEIAHRHFVILKAGNHQEIARSCPYTDMNMVYKSFGLLGAYVAPAMTVAAPVVEVPVVEVPKVEIPKVAIPVVAAAVIIPKVEIPKVEVPKLEVPVVEVPKLEIPKLAVPVVVAAVTAAAALHKPEVKKEEVKVVHQEVKKVIPPVVAAPLVEETSSGFNWWWLLLPLAALLAWWLWGQGCNKEQPVAVTPPIAVQAPKPITAETPKVVVPAAPSCDLNWIFFDFDKSEIRSDATASLNHLVTLMKENTSSTTLLKAFTDGRGTDGYNEALSLRRATAAKAYLTAHGIAAVRIKTDHLGKADPIAANTTDDTGRRYNRRVETYLMDKDGKRICESIDPKVPANLKK